uniref:Uncharacterized protein n=1 Tax=Acrobeloides nanus TaxID=290746 RepID=A0A914CXQ5_9BILA
MLVLTLTFGTLPIFIYRMLDRKQQKTTIKNGKPIEWPTIALSMLTCFSGGIFISLCFLDILNESLDSFNTLKDQNIWNINYPLVQLICLLSFFLIYTVDEISCKIFTHTHGHGHGHGHSHSPEQLFTRTDNIHNNNHMLSSHSIETISKISSNTITTTVGAVDGISAKEEIATDENNNNGTNQQENQAKNSDIRKTVEERRNIVKTMNFLLAIIFHSVFDGIALGVQVG